MNATRVCMALTLACLVAACDPGAQQEPEAIPRRDVPFQLLDTTSTTRDSQAAGVESPFSVYLVANERLVAANRSAEGSPNLTMVLRSLLEGPTAEEASLGVTSAIPSSTRLRKVSQRESVLTVDLARGFLTQGADETLAVAQLVWTATGLPDVEAVRFRVAGEPVQVPTGTGALAEGPVTRADYEPLAA